MEELLEDGLRKLEDEIKQLKINERKLFLCLETHLEHSLFSISWSNKKVATVLLMFLLTLMTQVDGQICEGILKVVPRCPSNAEEYQIVSQQCSKGCRNPQSNASYQYHCLRSSDKSKLIEVCAVSRFLFDYCPEYDHIGKVIQLDQSSKCNSNSTQRHYNSSDMFHCDRNCFLLDQKTYVNNATRAPVSKTTWTQVNNATRPTVDRFEDNDVRLIVREVRRAYKDYDWGSGTIEEAVRRVWRNMRDEDRRKSKGKLEEHRLESKRAKRIREKLKTRQTQFEKVKRQYEKSTRKEIRKCLVREATSPEVTDDEDETRRVAVPLVWESTRLRCLKRDLDADYRDVLKIQARRQKATVTRSQLEVTRTAPPRNIPEWAISSSYSF